MNSQTETTLTIPNSAPPHCQHRTASGRRCRMAVSDPDSGLCSRHAADRRLELDQADLSAALIGDIQEFRDPAAINHSLGELYKLQARNKINPRRAAVMAYTASLLLRTLPAIASHSQLKEQQEGLVLDFENWSDPRTPMALKDQPSIKEPSSLDVSPIRGRNPHDSHIPACL